MSVLTYQTLTDAETFLKTISNQASLRMSRVFRGMLFTQELSLVSAGSDQAVFKGARSRLEAGVGDRIYLHSPNFSEVLEARVIGLDVQLGRLVLGDFSVTGRTWTERKHERVQPRRPIRVMLRCDSCTLPTTLENISLEGVGLMAYKLSERGLEPRIGHSVNVDFELPLIRGRLSLSGHIVNIVNHGSRLACLGIHTFPDAEQARVLERYINLRKAEIVDELDNAFRAVFEPRSVKELYF